MKQSFFYTPKSILERIEDELRPLEAAFLTMLKQDSLKPETRKKIEQNLEAFSHFRKISEHAHPVIAKPKFHAA